MPFLLIGFVFFTFNGLIVLKTNSMRNPFNPRKHIEGIPAVVLGILSMLFGIYCLIGLISFL